jgi:hypothetical protein
MPQDHVPTRPDAVEPSGVDHTDDYGAGAQRSRIAGRAPLETDHKGLAEEQRSGFAAAEGREGPASEGGGH